MKRLINLILLLLTVTALLILNAWLPRWLNPYINQIIIMAGINIILAVSLNLINGFTGQFSIGHAGFMAVGGYASAAFTYYLWKLHFKGAHAPGGMTGYAIFFAALLIAALSAAVMGFLVGVPSLRLRGDYLAIVTLGFGEIIVALINNIEVVGGSRGFTDIPFYTNFFWVYLVVVATVLMTRNLVQSAHGRALIAVREDEIAADAMGINTTRYKVLAFVIGSACAGVAGALQGHYNLSLHPSAFKFLKSVEVIIMVVLGGMGSITGSVLTAIFVTVLLELLRFPVWVACIFFALILATAILSRPRVPLIKEQLVPQILVCVGATLLLVFALAPIVHSALLQVAWFKAHWAPIGTRLIFVGIAAAAVLPMKRLDVWTRFLFKNFIYALVLTCVLLFARKWFNDNAAGFRMIIYSALLVILMLNRPQGLFGKAELSAATWRRLFKPLAR
ncbi:MAG: branched-chain amino acid ABC transporter permease [Abditibacteriales bacterium]|nr:branched-chain amino acid ABC transporter permease [Abditibacteriales bacterium]MDW8364298.1 branched-chain amino acid ABC transporter permease [Abditibacteriales bacterium]